jgi:integrase
MGDCALCGLRSGELRALRWEAVDAAKRIIEVRESWDPKEGASSRRPDDPGEKCRCQASCGSC